MLVAPDKLDFRPQEGSVLDLKHAGAYGTSLDTYWVPGCRGSGGYSDVICHHAECNHWQTIRARLAID